MSLDKLKVRLVLQGQYMKQSVKYEHLYSPVQHASRFRTMIALATADYMLINHVDISQAFLQGDMLEKEGFEGNVYISTPPGYGGPGPEHAKYVYCLLRTTIRCVHQQSGMAQNHVSLGVRASRQMAWSCTDANRDKIMVGSHTDDFCIYGTNQACLDKFRFALLHPAKDGFEGTYEGPLDHYLGCGHHT